MELLDEMMKYFEGILRYLARLTIFASAKKIILCSSDAFCLYSKDFIRIAL